MDDKKSGYLKLKRVEKLILLVGNYEEQIFKKRADLRERKLRNILKELEDSVSEIFYTIYQFDDDHVML